MEAELSEFLGQYRGLKDDWGRQAVVREVAIQVQKVRDRTSGGIKFTSQLLPSYLKRSHSGEEVLPWLSFNGVSTGDFGEVLAALLGPEAKGLSSGTISRLKSKWGSEYQDWQGRSLKHKRYVYVWADGIYFNIRAEERQCIGSDDWRQR